MLWGFTLGGLPHCERSGFPNGGRQSFRGHLYFTTYHEELDDPRRSTPWNQSGVRVVLDPGTDNHNGGMRLQLPAHRYPR